MIPSSARGLIGVVVLWSASMASAHPKGFHTKLTITVTSSRVSVLAVMDVDAGPQTLVLREAVDADRNGLLEGDELTTLKNRLTKLVTGPLKLGLSGAPLALQVKDSKLSTREDRRAGDGPLSIAVLLELDHANALAEGMQLEVTDVAPDQSSIALQVFQATGSEKPVELELPSGVKQLVRLGALMNAR